MICMAMDLLVASNQPVQVGPRTRLAHGPRLLDSYTHWMAKPK